MSHSLLRNELTSSGAELGFCRSLWLLILSLCCCRILKASMTAELQEEKGGSQTSSDLSCNFLVALRFHQEFDIWEADSADIWGVFKIWRGRKIKDKEQISALFGSFFLVIYGTLHCLGRILLFIWNSLYHKDATNIYRRSLEPDHITSDRTAIFLETHKSL